MANLSAQEKRYLENAVFIAASRLIFTRLAECGTSLKKLSDVADTTSGGTPLRNAATYFGGDIPWVKSGDLNDGLIESVEEFITEEGLQNSSAKIFPAGTIVIALYGATVGKTGILTFEAATNQAVCAIFPRPSELKKEYLYWFLRHKRQDFLEMSFGGAQPNISQKLLRETLVPVPSSNIQTSVTLFLGAVEKRRLGDNVKLPDLPEPLADLTYAVAHIEALAARIAEARGLRQQAVEEAKILVSAAWRQINSANITEDWIRLSEYVQEIENGLSPDALKRPANLDEWGVLKVGSVSFGVFNPNENKALPTWFTLRPEYEVKPGDLLMSRANTLSLVGACALVEETRPKLMLSDKYN